MNHREEVPQDPDAEAAADWAREHPETAGTPEGGTPNTPEQQDAIDHYRDPADVACRAPGDFCPLECAGACEWSELKYRDVLTGERLGVVAEIAAWLRGPDAEEVARRAAAAGDSPEVALAQAIEAKWKSDAAKVGA